MVAPFGSAACRSLEFRCCGSSGREAVGGGGSGGFSIGSVETVLFVFQLARSLSTVSEFRVSFTTVVSLLGPLRSTTPLPPVPL